MEMDLNINNVYTITQLLWRTNKFIVAKDNEKFLQVSNGLCHDTNNDRELATFVDDKIHEGKLQEYMGEARG